MPVCQNARMAAKGVITHVINATQFSRLCHTDSAVNHRQQKILYTIGVGLGLGLGLGLEDPGLKTPLAIIHQAKTHEWASALVKARKVCVFGERVLQSFKNSSKN